MNKLRKVLAGFLIAAVNLSLPAIVQADPSPVSGSVTVTATVPQSTATFSGFAPVSSTVTIKDNSVVAGTTTTTLAGTFSKTIISTPGLHDFSLYLTDTAGRTTPETIFSGVAIISQTDNPISNIHLAPTIALSKSTIFKGETVSVFGQGAKGSTIHVFINGVERFTSNLTTSDWQFTFGQSHYNVGANSFYAYLTRSSVVNSINSFTKILTVNNCKRSDLNCDTFVNLTDFSILLYYWGSSHTPADTNGDGKVGLIDFSIMMFDWTG
jgi:hypothetical protein